MFPCYPDPSLEIRPRALAVTIFLNNIKRLLEMTLAWRDRTMSRRSPMLHGPSIENEPIGSIREIGELTDVFSAAAIREGADRRQAWMTTI
jgi:hypothetical protein